MAFGYGKALHADLGPATHCLEFFSLGICAWCLHPVLMRSFYAMHKSVTPIVIGTLTTFLFVGLYFVLRPLFPGDTGYLAMPLSGSLAAIVMVIGLGAAAYRDVEGFNVTSVLGTLLKSGIAAAVAGGFGKGFFMVFTHHGGRLLAAALFLFVVLIAAWIYYFITKAFGMPETRYLVAAVNKVKRRPGPPPTI